MWCRNCQQEVPAIATGAEGAAQQRYCCARCNDVLAMDFGGDDESTMPRGEVFGTMETSNDAVAGQIRPPVDVDDWDFGIDLAEMDSLVTTSDPVRSVRPVVQKSNEFDHGWHSSGALASAMLGNLSAPHEKSEVRRPRSSLLGWTFTLLGLTVFVCGGVLMGWSLAEDRGELWHAGLPLVLVGQGVLLVGLVLQLERMWHNHRRASDDLHKFDEELADLKQTTDLLGTTQSTASQAFYSHLAAGASSEVLLADLKGQMDMMAVQMVRRAS